MRFDRGDGTDHAFLQPAPDLAQPGMETVLKGGEKTPPTLGERAAEFIDTFHRVRNGFFHQDGAACPCRRDGHFQVQSTGVGDDHSLETVRQRGFDCCLHGYISDVLIRERGVMRAQQQQVCLTQRAQVVEVAPANGTVTGDQDFHILTLLCPYFHGCVRRPPAGWCCLCYRQPFSSSIHVCSARGWSGAGQSTSVDARCSDE